MDAKELQKLLDQKRADEARIIMTGTAYVLTLLADGLADRTFPAPIRPEVSQLRAQIGALGVELGLLANKKDVD